MEPDASAQNDTVMDEGRTPDPAFVVAGLGASAGGVEALEAFVAGLPEVDGVAFVVVLHLAPDEESRLADVLQGGLPLPVTQVTEAVTIEPGHVYVIPPNKNLLATDGRLVLEPIEEERVRRRPIDHFFRTLAYAYGERAVGVVLSGTGANGTVGVRAINEAGGMILAQDPAEAAFDEVPRTAIASGVVDGVGPAGALAAEVAAYAHRLRRVQLPDAPGDLPGDGAKALQGVLAQLRARTGHDFAHYKRATVLRRLDRRLHVTGAESLADYLAVLRESAAEADALLDDLLISVTNFFRDRQAFQVLERAVPRLFEGKGTGGEVRVWVPGCATGEEAYTIAMVLLEHAATLAEPPRVQVFATDLSDQAIRTARAGAYPESIEADVNPERLKQFFVRESGRYRVSDVLREAVLFAPHSLLVDPPFSSLDLVSCRNLLIYFQRTLQQQALALFHYALRPGGLLFLGTSESTGDEGGLFATVDKKARLYRRLDVKTPPPALPHVPRVLVAPAPRPDGPPPRARAEERAPSEAEQLHRRLREETAPPSVLVGETGDVAHVADGAAVFLQVPSGPPTRTLAKMLRPELRAVAQSALFQARREGRDAEAGPADLDLAGERRSVRVRARPVAASGLVQVVFDVLPAAPAPLAPADDGGVLAEALRQTQEQLQVSVEEFETSREELRAQNEELQSINEELRSTAEELETSKEEAQSMAEELRTVNDELKGKVDETARVKGDLENLIISTEIATLFLDRQLRIQRFTPPVRDLFHVRASDVGRPLADLAQRFGGAPLVEDAEAVLARLEVTEREVEGEDGRWHLVHARPYRSVEDRTDGVVVTFVDITRRKADEAALRQSEDRLRRVAETVPDILFRTTPDGTVDFVNGAFQALTGRPPDAVLGTQMWPGLVHPDDLDATEAAWDHARATESRFEARHRIVSGDGWCWVIARARPFPDDDGAVTAWFGTLTDVDALTRAEDEVRRLNAGLAERVAEQTERVRDLSARLAAAEEEERRRIALVLHDDLQQQLAGLAMILSVLRRSPAAEDDRELHARAAEIVDGASALTRSLASEMSPPSLASDDFAETARWLAERKRQDHDLDVVVEAEGCDVPDRGARTLLYQALRELLFNVVKHAGTGRATVRARRDGADVVVEVEDDGDGFDGDGFDGDATPTSGGLGLYNVRERIERAGGRLDLASEPGRGTRVTVTLPAGG